MSNLISNFNDRVKFSSAAMMLMAFKIFTGLLIGLTFALIGDQVMDYGWFSFLLVITVFTGALYKIMKTWTWLHVGIFNLICVLIGLCLRMYILIAPG